MTDIVHIGTPTFASQEAATPLTVSYDLVGGNNRNMLVAVSSWSQTSATFSGTFGGASLSVLHQQRYGSMNVAIMQLREDNIIGDGINDLVVSWTGGNNPFRRRSTTCEASKGIM